MDRKQEPSGLQKDKERGGILKNLDIQNYIRHTIIQCPLKYPAKSETFHLNKAIESLKEENALVFHFHSCLNFWRR